MLKFHLTWCAYKANNSAPVKVKWSIPMSKYSVTEVVPDRQVHHRLFPGWKTANFPWFAKCWKG